MHREVEFTDEIMCTQVFHLLRVIVRVVYLNLKLFTLFEVEVESDFGDPLGVQIVMDDFSLAKFLPDVSLVFIKYDKRIGLGKSIHVHQVFTCETQFEFLSKTTASEIGSGKYSSINI